MNRLLKSGLGLALIGVGVYLAFNVEGRGDMLVIFFVALGGFFISQSLIVEFFQSVWGRIRNGGN